MASRTLITGEEGGGGEEKVGASVVANTNTGCSTRLHHTIFFPHSVVSQEELEHRLLDQLSERLQASEAQLREEMARKVSDGATILCVNMLS